MLLGLSVGNDYCYRLHCLGMEGNLWYYEVERLKVW